MLNNEMYVLPITLYGPKEELYSCKDLDEITTKNK